MSSKQIEERRMQTELERVNERLNSYADLEDWQGKLELLDQGFIRVKALDEQILWFEERSLKRQELGKKLQLADQYLSRLSSIDLAGEKWIEAQALDQKWSHLVQLHRRLVTTHHALREADGVILKTQTLELTSPMVVEVEKKWNLLGSLEGVGERKKRLHNELVQIHRIVKETQQIDQGEQRFNLLQESSVKGDQLVLLQGKQREYGNIRQKIDLVLTKTVSYSFSRTELGTMEG